MNWAPCSQVGHPLSRVHHFENGGKGFSPDLSEESPCIHFQSFCQFWEEMYGVDDVYYQF